MAYTFIRTPDPVYIRDRKAAQEWAERYEKCDSVGFDTETTGLSNIKARIKFFSFSDGETRVCGPVRLLGEFKGILENPAISKRMTNAKFDTHMCASHEIYIKGDLLDTVIMDWLLDENRRGQQHGLKICAKDYLGLQMAPFKDVFGAVGSKDKEVEMVSRMHDALERSDEGYALELLSIVGKVYGAPAVIEDLKKVSKALVACRESKVDAWLAPSVILRIARKHEFCPRTRTKLGGISDLMELLGADPVPKEDREDLKWLLTDEGFLEECMHTLLSKLKDLVLMDTAPLDMLELLVGDYASLDAWASYMLADELLDRLDVIDVEPGQTLKDMFMSKYVPFTRTIWNMERRGFALDMDALQDLADPLQEKLDLLSREFVSQVGWDVNPNSTKDLREVFFTKNPAGEWLDPFGNTPFAWTSGGASGNKQPSIAKAVIEEWAERGHPLASLLQEYRTFEKIHGTYLTSLPGWVDGFDRIHTQLLVHGTVTGRLSSRNPNLQNIPARGPWGSRIRKLFIAGKYGDSLPFGHDAIDHVAVPDFAPDQEMTLIVADYEQLEMRIMAHMSGDSTMCATIHDGKDLHSMTAALAGGHNYDRIVAAKKADNPTQEDLELIDVRAGMKAVGFGLLYGIGAGKLGRQLGLPIIPKRLRNGHTYDTCPEAQDLIDTYFGIYPDVQDFIHSTHEFVEDHLHVRTILGRYRRLPEMLSKLKGLRNRIMRQSVNSIIQGSAADIVNTAMLKCELSPKLRALGVRMLLQIHDELVFEAPNIPEIIEEAKEEIRKQMENPIPMRVPIIVSMDEALSWGEAK
jgi:DNA polymerase I-like protein with 3'-5' exonuclease and polymerase domains